MDEKQIIMLIEKTLGQIGIAANFHGDRVDAFREGVVAGIRHVMTVELIQKSKPQQEDEERGALLGITKK